MSHYTDDLWFLPGPPEDMSPTDPPWPTAPRAPRIDPVSWHHDHGGLAGPLALAAEEMGRLREALRHAP